MGQCLPESVPVGPAESQPGAVDEPHLPVAVSLGDQRSYPVKPYQGTTVDPSEDTGIEALVESRQCLTNKIRLAGAVQPRVVSGGFDPIDCADRDRVFTPPGSHQEPGQILSWFGRFETAPLKRWKARLLELPDKLPETLSDAQCPVLFEPSADPAQGKMEARLDDRLEEIVDNRDLERVQGMFVMSRDQHHRRYTLRPETTQHLDTAFARHLDIEEEKIRSVPIERFRRLLC